MSTEPSGLILGLLLIGFSLGVSNAADSEYIKCPLEWRPASTGEPLPALTLPTTIGNTEHFIARRKGSDGSFLVGRFEAGAGAAFFPTLSTTVEKETQFEVLTNLHNCIINWAEGITDSPYAVSSGTPGTFVGRGHVSGLLFSGHVASGSITLVQPNKETLVQLTKYESLHSYSKGLRLQVSKFIFENDGFGANSEFMGIDQIINEAASTVVQTVSHRRRISESVVISNFVSWGHVVTVGLDLSADLALNIIEEDLPGGVNVTVPVANPALNFEFQPLNYLSNRSEVFQRAMEREVVVSREIRVPPFSSVQVCSTVNVKDDFMLDYVAVGKYTAPGLRPEEVQAILAKDGKVGAVQGNGVIVEERGQLGGSLALNTQFIVVPLGGAGCSRLSAKLSREKKGRKVEKLRKLGFTLNNFPNF